MIEVKECIECKRKLPATDYYFRKHSRSNDGLNHKCKECVFKRKMFAREGYSICKECKEELPLTSEYFYIDRQSAKGFKSKCKKCEGSSYAINGKYGLFDIKWKEIDILSGIYRITCLGNNKFYIGSAVNFCARWSVHINLLRNNKHENNYLQNTFNKYGFDSFKFEIIEFVEDVNKLLEREQYWLDYYKPYDRRIGFNILKVAGNCLGNEISEETKMKLRKATGKRINQYDLNGNLLKSYVSANYASKISGKSSASITQCANGKKLKSAEFIWLYEDGNETIEERLKKIDNSTRRIVQYDLDGNFVAEYKMKVSELAKIKGKEYLQIPNCVMGDTLSVAGYMWRYRYPNEPLVMKIDSWKTQFDKNRVKGNEKRKKKTS